MASVTITRGNTLPDSSSKADFHNLIDQASGSISNVVNADIDSAAAIADTKLATISTSQKVNLSAVVATSQATGDTVYASSSTVLSRLAGNTTTTKKFLTQTGNGSISAAPAWDTIVAGDLTPVILTPKEYTDAEDTTTSNETTNSSSYQDTTLSITFTVGKQGLVFASFDGAGVSDSGTGKWALVVNGTAKKEVCHIAGSGDQLFPVAMAWHGVLAAGSHTIKIQIKNDGGGGVTHVKGATCTARLNVSYPT